MTTKTAAPAQRVYRQEPEWMRRARENKLPAKVTGGRAA